jgi:hypothetical protein
MFSKKSYMHFFASMGLTLLRAVELSRIEEFERRERRPSLAIFVRELDREYEMGSMQHHLPLRPQQTGAGHGNPKHTQLKNGPSRQWIAASIWPFIM